MDKLLITGGSGFLGGHLVRAAEKRFRVTATYHEHLPADQTVEWIRMDLADSDRIDKVVRQVEPDVIMHTAALSRVERCERSPALARIVNEHAVSKLGAVSRSLKARILSISSDLIFDGLRPPYSETSPIGPLSVYAKTKAAGEDAIAGANPDHVIIRPSLIFGRPVLLGSSFSEWMHAAWVAGETTPLYTDQYRTPVFAGNLAQAMLELAVSDFTGIIHLAGTERINRHEFGVALAERLGFDENLIRPVKMSEVGRPGRRPADVSLDIGLARTLLDLEFLDCRAGLLLAYPDPADG